MTPPFQTGLSSGAAPGGSAAGPYDEIRRILADLPRPRPVRMSRRGKIIATVVSMALLASLGLYAAAGTMAQRTAGSPNNAPSQIPTYALFIAFIAVFVVVMLRMIGRQKRLLAEGELAVGLVTQQLNARNGPVIRYEFNTPVGEHISGSAADGSRQLAVGMTVPIFCDPQSPKKRLALCASFYEVVLPGEE